MTPPRQIPYAVFLIALATLMLELALTRAFDAILSSQMAYMIITCVMFSFGLAGVYSTLRPPPADAGTVGFVARLAVILAICTLIILPAMNILPFNYEKVMDEPVLQLFSFLGMYLVLAAPFFIAGLIFTTVFSAYSKQIQRLYFWDLTGAALGCIVMIPLIAPIGPGGLTFCAAALCLFAAALLAGSPLRKVIPAAIGLALVAAPIIRAPDYFDFREHVDKRSVKSDKEAGRLEMTRWDPVSKIDVIDRSEIDPVSGETLPLSRRKHIAYDGGSQSSHIFQFDGNFQALREGIHNKTESVNVHFWNRGILASHFLKRDSNQKVLIIGSAGGQETKAALMYGAGEVDAVEMVKAVVELGKGKYADYNGNIFNHRNVTVVAGEGRSFLRATKKKYDIIQIFSNHTTSSIAAGSGAMGPVYLQTAEAYEEYFEHLAENGILHINHHIYPRMVLTAAVAWKQTGRTDFHKHVAVFEKVGELDTLPTFLVKMQPWTEAELKDAQQLFGEIQDDETPFEMVVNPLGETNNFLSSVFFTGKLPDDLARSMEFRVSASTDDQPFFNFLRKTWSPVAADPAKFTSEGTAQTLNLPLRKDFIPMDVIHLFVTGIVSILFAIAFIFVPLCFARVGKTRWKNKYASIVYFSCLGSGFIILELVYIQIFMKLIGFPVYTYSVVIFAMLLAAGIGSLASGKLGITPGRRWTWPFLGVLATGILLALVHPVVFKHFLASPLMLRIAVACLMLLPVGFFLGMAFPLGILAIEKQPSGAIAWAWGMNGLFTVVGGLASVILAIYLGFTTTMFVGLAIYIVAFIVFASMRSSWEPSHPAPNTERGRERRTESIARSTTRGEQAGTA